MAKNRHRAEGNQVKLPVDSAVVAGDLVVFGAGTSTALVGVALTDADENDEATVQFDGSWRFEFTTVGALAVGDPIYITGAGVLTQTSTSNFLVGNSLTALAGTTTDEIEIRLKN